MDDPLHRRGCGAAAGIPAHRNFRPGYSSGCAPSCWVLPVTSAWTRCFHLRGSDIYRVLEMRRVPGRREFPGAGARASTSPPPRAPLSERMANCGDMADLLDTPAGRSSASCCASITRNCGWRTRRSSAHPARQPRLRSRRRRGAEISVGDGHRRYGGARRRADPRRAHDEHGHLPHAPCVNAPTSPGYARRRALKFRCPDSRNPRSQLAVSAARARGVCWGALLVESQHDQFFGYDDEDALMMLCGS